MSADRNTEYLWEETFVIKWLSALFVFEREWKIYYKTSTKRGKR